jgi:hypothetical protein
MSSPSQPWCFAVTMAGWLFVSAAIAPAQSLTAVEDNFVLKSVPTTVQTNGTTLTLKVASASQSNARIAFLKFDVSSVPSIADPLTFTATATGAFTADATLRLFALNAGAAGFNWSEDTITYANRPAPSDAGVLVDTALATSVGSSVTIPTGTAAGAKASFSFSGIDSFRQSDGTLTLIFLVSSQSSSTPSFAFASSENSDPTAVPTLTVPEPATCALAATGALGLLLRRRRR